MRSSVIERDAGLHGLARAGHVHRAPVEQQLAARERGDAEERLDELGATGALQAGDADDLAGAQLEVDVVDVAVAGAAQLEARLAEHGALLGLGEVRGDRAADHAAHQLVGVELRGRAARDERAVLQHGDGVAEVEDLLQPVRDVEDRDAARLEAAHDRVEQLDLVVGERGRRLVHLDDPRVDRERLHDLDDLLLGDGEGAHRGIRVDAVDAELGRAAPASRGPSPCGRRSRRACGSRPRNTFCATVRSGSRLNSWKTVASPARAAWTGCVNAHLVAAERDRAGVALVDAREDLHEGRLAGAVLADEAVHLAGPEREPDAVQHLHAEERLLEALGDEHGLGLGARLPPPARVGLVHVGHATTSSHDAGRRGGEHGLGDAHRAQSVVEARQSVGRRAADRGVGVGDEGVERVLVAHRMPRRHDREPCGVGRETGRVAIDARVDAVGAADPELLGPLLLEAHARVGARELDR